MLPRCHLYAAGSNLISSSIVVLARLATACIFALIPLSYVNQSAGLLAIYASVLFALICFETIVRRLIACEVILTAKSSPFNQGKLGGKQQALTAQVEERSEKTELQTPSPEAAGQAEELKSS